MESKPELSHRAPEVKDTFTKPIESTIPAEPFTTYGQEDLREVRLDLAKEKGGDKDSKDRQKKTGEFEPFVNPEPTNDHLLINGYNGNFAQRMSLNRKVAERVLKIAHLDGKVVFTSLVSSKKPSAEAQGEELVAKRNLFFGEKIEDDNKDNPYHRVIPTSQGWRIEINNTRIMEELEKKKLTGKELENKFIQEFNVHLGQGLWGCIWREKLTTVKDKRLVRKIAANFLAHGPTFLLPATLELLLPSLPTNWYSLIGMGLFFQALYNGILQFRKLDSLGEYLMPFVEVDKVARSLTYLFLKGNTLVREKEQEK